MFAGRKFAAFLFDMDGTLINSIASAERVWGDWARRHGLDVAAFLPTIHGVRAIETITALALPGVDPGHEADLLLKAEADDLDGIVQIAGAVAFLNSLPPERWAIVTSAPRSLALARMKVAGIPVPAVLVAAEDVSRGKPAPDCFQLGARRLGFDARDCLVFEDAPAGIAAAEAAGASVMVINATHQHPLATQHAAISGYDAIGITVDERGWVALEPQRNAA
ncbi:haloacid dehalogenase superfamily protein, subfamily IA, variant 3 with third motif having DD or ED [Mesorhizobium australicum WSM2073]|uniref:Haloacid dehalogenase superfamily protein, subfamily IA, variant 3 with third motif having DD or ED n=1 Tax=Mesorhizobium australicum (strain HAMBI 3006 / LMG 24608 / WSM2073) TaxID=754035 RepID=L0KHZ1_MESAW|nr:MULTISPECIES: HAD-IA family hydrolase [Mesorhizobium]AGB43678.1 haloacid dehalogenase superfamily protein, subfamily IA, variant 3 with third motif having DD or ED [Mesorhizobium australicum WSM2073]MBZ9908791.1 HAD-IA family hydrolase [Mesorhizobium sp. BR115XR7A]MBZ9932239.1 HAD-IA family hydrolase [Mesorhizobium sp. BR1-1-5]MBZ9975925.1 HAD-IA family hydrolase [Mesorhizobium sp. BR-1-1-10]